MRPSRATIRRSVLVRRMNQRWDHRLTLVVAGPGFGKTTLLAAALAENALRPLGDDRWLTCDRDDALAGRFAEALLQALDPQRDGQVARLDSDPIRGARAVADAIWQRAPRHTCLFLDDLDQLAGGSSAIALLAELVRILPANGHIVMASRVAPPLALTRHEVEGWICRIDELDLAMDDDELGDFAALRGVPPEQIDGVGGWPALVELRALGSRGRVDDFLFEEVLSGFDERERRILATVAAIGRTDGELLSAVSGHDVDLPALLERLPLASCDEIGWCEVAPLWSECLDSLVDPAERDRVRREAGRRLVEHDFLAGIDLLFAADDLEGIEAALRASFRGHGVPASASALDRLWRDLPRALRARPIGVLLKGIAVATRDIDRGVPHMEAALRAFEEAGDQAGTLLVIEHLAILYHWQENLEALTDLAARLDRLSHLDDARGLIALGRALVADTAGDAAALLVAAEDADEAELSEDWRGLVAWWSGTALLALGLPDAAQRKAETAISSSSLTLAGVFRMLHVSTLFLSGSHEAGVAALDQMVEVLDGAGNKHTSLLGYCHAATHYALAGQVDQAREHLRAAQLATGPAPSTSASAAVVAAEIVVAVGSGDDDRARSLLQAQREGRALGEGRRRYGELRRLALQYVLEPATREYWDAAALGPCYVLALDLARALCAVREDGSLTLSAALGAEHWSVAPGFIPANWRAELVVAAASAGSRTGAGEAEKLGPLDRPMLRHIASRGDLPRVTRGWVVTLLESIPSVPTAPIDVCVLGVTTLQRGGVATVHPHWRRQRVRLLLLLLIARGGGSREELAGLLWPDLDAERAAHNLRVNLSYLLTVLEPDREDGEPSYFVRSEAASIHLVGHDWLWVDAWEFDRLVDLAGRAERQGEPSLALRHLTAAVRLYCGPYMADAGYENWALPHRDRLSARFVSAAVRAGELTLAAGDTAEALILASRALEAEPYSESAHCLAVAAHLRAGDRSAALRALETCKRQLDELGTSPSENVELLERALHAS